MAKYETHKSNRTGKENTLRLKTIRRDRNQERRIVDRNLSRLIGVR